MTDPRNPSYNADDPLAPLLGAGETVAPDAGFKRALLDRLLVVPPTIVADAPDPGLSPAAGSSTFPWPAALTAALGAAVMGYALLLNRPSDAPTAAPPAPPAAGEPLSPEHPASPTATMSPAVTSPDSRSDRSPQAGDPPAVASSIPPVEAPAATNVLSPVEPATVTASPATAPPPADPGPPDPDPPRPPDPDLPTATPSPEPTDLDPWEPPPVPPTSTPDPTPEPRPTIPPLPTTAGSPEVG